MDFMLINFTKIIKKYNMNITGIIHIGAHYGEEIRDYIDNGIEDIILFEPLSDNFNILEKNVKNLSANIVGHQVALGSTPGNATMYVSSNEKQSSSILKPKVHLTHHPNVSFPSTEVVEVKTLDQFETFNFNFINMDVQGYELEVLKGASKTLTHIDYVYCEVNRDEVYENNAFIEQIDEYLSQYNLVRVETDWGGEIWGDALYVKTTLN
jgi:FkbM family methyltransferase